MGGDVLIWDTFWWWVCIWCTLVLGVLLRGLIGLVLGDCVSCVCGVYVQFYSCARGCLRLLVPGILVTGCDLG